MSELMKNDREVVIPGEEIVKSMDYLPGRNCFREKESIFAKRLGIVSVENRVISVIPLSGVYMPRAGDMVIGEVLEAQGNGWVVNVKAPYEGYLSLSGIREFIDTNKTELSSIYAVGDAIYASVESFSTARSVYLSMEDPKNTKLRGGRMIEISPAKVPRLIGKQGSMIKMIKDKTGCRVIAGQNGLVWMQGEREDVVLEAIALIEKEAHLSGLTDKVGMFLDSRMKEVKT
jgi:exosome complex component RRP4